MNKNLLGFLISVTFVVFFIIIFYNFQIINYPQVDIVKSMGRVFGMVGFMLVSFSVIYGLYQSNRLYLKFKLLDSPLSLATHRYLSWFGLFFGIFHRQTVEFLWYQLPQYPIFSDTKSFLLLLGNLALLFMFIILLTSELRGKYVPIVIWRSIHYLSFVTYFMVLYHALQLGTNSTEPFYIFCYASTFMIIMSLIGLRIYNSLNAKNKINLAKKS
jgi:methionine sulfoxide reductase heme-binding subunit